MGSRKKVVYTRGSYSNYYQCDSYSELRDILYVNYLASKASYICEYVDDNNYVNLFFDIDIKKDSSNDVYALGTANVNNIIKTTFDIFKGYRLVISCMYSHQYIDKADILSKFSCHLVIKIYRDEVLYMFCGITQLKIFVENFYNKFIIDLNVYKPMGTLFRTIYSNKPQQKRPLLLTNDILVDGPYCDVNYEINKENIMETFIGYKSDEEITRFEAELINIGDYISGTANTEEISSVPPPFISNLLENFIEDYYPKKAVKFYETKYIHDKNLYFKEFKGECPNIKKIHSNNNIRLVIGSDYFTINCFKENCGKGIKESTITHMNDLVYKTLFGNKEVIKEAISLYLKDNNIDKIKEIKDIIEEDDGFSVPVTDNLNKKYTIRNGVHRISNNEHYIKDNDNIEVVEEFDKSPLYALLRNPKRVNIIKNNSFIKHYHEAKKPVEKKTDLTVISEKIDLIDGSLESKELEDKIKTWANAPNFWTLSSVFSVSSLFQNLRYSNNIYFM